MGSIPTPATMNILVLDDMEVRHRWFVNNLARFNAILYQARTAREAIELLKETTFDVMFLDHDLGDRVYVDSDDPNTGYQVAKYIRENDIECNRIIIHSLNKSGVDNMMALLPNAEYIPFTVLPDWLVWVK